MLPVYASRTSHRHAPSSSILHSFSWASLLHRALTYTTTIPHLYFAAPMHNVSSLFSLSVPLCSPPSAYTETLSCVPRYIHHTPHLYCVPSSSPCTAYRLFATHRRNLSYCKYISPGVCLSSCSYFAIVQSLVGSSFVNNCS